MATKFTPFPTFGGKDGIAGITPVKLAPTQMRFPTPRSRPSQGQAPADVNPMAFIAPLLLQGIGNKFFQKDPVTAPIPKDTDINKTYSIEDIRSQLGDTAAAEYQADQIYGPRMKDTRRSRIGNFLLDYLPALALNDPRELSGYMNMTNALRKDEQTKALERKKFVGANVNAMAGKVLNVTPAYDVNNTEIARSAIEGPNGGFYISSLGTAEDVTVDGKKVPVGEYYRNPKWIIGEPYKNDATLKPTAKNVSNEWVTKRDELETVASSLRAFAPTMTDAVQIYMSNEELATWWRPFTELKNSGKAFINAVKQDKGIVLENNPDGRLSWFDQSTGEVTEAFLKGDVIPYMEEVYNPNTKSFEMQPRELDLRTYFGDAANDAELRSIIINMAYMAAAANGQTGRTLSDRDLALHLQALGSAFEGGGIKDPKAALRAMTGWYHRTMENASIKMQELERSSLANDWRSYNQKDTPWAPRYATGTYDQLTQAQIDKGILPSQKLFKLSQTWSNEKDADWITYLNTLAQAKYKFRPTDRSPGSNPIKDNPIKGIDWYNNYYLPYLELIQGEGVEDKIDKREVPGSGRSGVG